MDIIQQYLALDRDLQNSIFFEEHPFSLLKIAKLLLECLESKWKRNSDKRVFSSCRFCHEYLLCSRCPCPPSICGDDGHKGVIGELHSLNLHETPIKELPAKYYRKVINTFAKELEAILDELPNELCYDF